MCIRDRFTIANSGHCGMTIRSGSSNYGTIYFSDADDGSADEVRGFVEYNHSDNQLSLGSNGSARLRITQDGSATRMGLGIVPQASQYSGWTVLQVGESAALTSNRTTGDTNTTELSNNSYLNSNASAYKYHHTDEATRYVQAHGRHTWYTAASGSADATISFTEVMKVDASGYVTKPANPMFKAGMTASRTISSNGWHKIQFDTDTASDCFDVGSNYDASNHRFTAPVTGYYQFGLNQRVDGGDGDYFRVAFSLNDDLGAGDNYPYGHAIYRDADGFAYFSFSITSLIYMTAGQYAQVFVTHLDQQTDPDKWCTFMGYLLS